MKGKLLIVIVFATLYACAPNKGSSVEDAALEQTARDVVAMLGGYDCVRLPGYLPEGAEEMLRSNIDAPLLEGMADPIERVCFVLGLQDHPRSETMEVAAVSQTRERAVLELSESGDEGILIDLSPDLPPTRLSFVKEAGSWKLDPAWALKEVQDHIVKSDLLGFNVTQLSYFGTEKRFTADPEEITRTMRTVPTFYAGVASNSVSENVVFASLAPDGRSICGSARSRSGELFMIRADADGTTSFARGENLPNPCPGKPLDSTW